MRDAVHDARPSFIQIERGALDLLPTIGATAFAVYAAMIQCASHDDRQCFPAKSTLSRRTGLSVRTVDLATAKLVEAGLIAVEARSREGARTSNLYTILAARGGGAKSAGGTANIAGGGADSAGGVPQNLRGGTAKSAGRTITIELEPTELEKPTPPNPRPLSAAEPRNLPAPRPGNDGGNAASSNGSAQRTRRTRPAVEATKAATPRPRDPAFDAFMGAFPTAAASLAAKFSKLVRGKAAVGDWDAWLREVREDRAKGYVKAHNACELFLAWLAARRSPAVADTGLDARMRAAGAPGNWREIVYAPGGVRRAPALALPLLGLEPYAPVEAWPAWYRAIEGQGVAA